MPDNKDANNTNKIDKLEEEHKAIPVDEYSKSINALRNTWSKSSTSNLAKIYKDISINTPNLNEDFLEAFKKTQESYQRIKISGEISNLEAELQNKIEKLHDDLSNNLKNAEDVNNLRDTIEKLTHKRAIQHLLDSVSSKAHAKLEGDEDFRRKFSSEKEVNAFVVSVDIRRSTELMLKARSPRLFANFITTLCNDLVCIFKDNWAVVDKFTGDGILAFFPEFFSGIDAGYHALKSATLANEAFAIRYREYRSSFSTVLREVGLGTGIDYGKVHLVRMAGALTIVGQPVVYACRLGGAPAGRIFLNQPAFEVANTRYPHLTTIVESAIDIKSEGSLICYDTQLNKNQFAAEIPEWLAEYKG